MNQLCTPSLTIRKLAQTPGDAHYTPVPGWRRSRPRRPWTAASTSGSSPTRARRRGRDAGTRPTRPTRRRHVHDRRQRDRRAPGTRSVRRRHLGRHHRGAGARLRLGGRTTLSWRCTLKNVDGSQDDEFGELGTRRSGSDRRRPNQIITCTIYNSFDYEPDIALVKVDNPTQVLGSVPNTITSTFTVTNPGNTPLSDVTVTDDRCAPVFQSGDTNGDGSSPRRTARAGSSPAPATSPAVLQPARARYEQRRGVGHRPHRGEGHSGRRRDRRRARPAIADEGCRPTEIEVGVATPVTYTYVATNTGNMTLTDVTVSDSIGPATCSPVTPASVASLAPGASASFTCTLTLTAADASATYHEHRRRHGRPDLPGWHTGAAGGHEPGFGGRHRLPGRHRADQAGRPRVRVPGRRSPTRTP